MSADRFCSRCGAPVEAEAAFCKKCGQDMTQVYTPPPTQQAPPQGAETVAMPPQAAETIAMPPQGGETIAMPPQGGETVQMPQGAETIALPQGVTPTDATVMAGATTPTAGNPQAQPPRVQATMRQQLRDATLGEYEILSELGRGGMATVFLAHDISLDRKVAIKVMAPHLLEGDGMVERFKLEARTAAQLSHPHIIPIYAVKWTDTTIYFVMKFIEGRPLDDIIKKMAPLPIPMVKDILIKVGGALGYGHRRDVVHRDIKPANIMIDEEGTPIVTDFGIAKVANEGGGLTMTGTTIGTPSYMSPEQCEAKEVSGASDQYSLGVLAWEMLTGKLPFEGKSAVSTMYMHCHEPLPPLLDFRPDCPPEVLETVARMLAKDPKDRWPSLEAAIQKLGTESTMSYMDPVHSELVELVKQGDHRELLARIQTPRSPIPVGRTGETTAPGAQASEKRSSKGLIAAGIAVAVIGGGALAVLQPWAASAEGDPVVQAPVEQPADPTPDTDPPVETVAGGAVDGGEDTPVDGTPDGGGEVVAETPTEPDPVVEEPTPNNPPPVATVTVASVRIDNAPGSLQVGQNALLAGVVMGSNNAPMTNQTIQWRSSDPNTVSVDGAGRVSARQAGSATITATAGGQSATHPITVSAVPVSSVTVSTTSLSLTVGMQSGSVTATPRDRSNQPMNRPVTWSSNNSDVASVNASGTVTPVGPGQTMIVASSEGITANVTVTVAENPQSAAERIIQAYATALETRDIGQVQRVHEGLTAEERQTLADGLPFMENLDATLTIVDFRLTSATRAEADVTGVYVFNANGRQEAPQSFVAEFEFRGGAWHLVRTR